MPRRSSNRRVGSDSQTCPEQRSLRSSFAAIPGAERRSSRATLWQPRSLSAASRRYRAHHAAQPTRDHVAIRRACDSRRRSNPGSAALARLCDRGAVRAEVLRGDRAREACSKVGSAALRKAPRDFRTSRRSHLAHKRLNRRRRPTRRNAALSCGDEPHPAARDALLVVCRTHEAGVRATTSRACRGACVSTLHRRGASAFISRCAHAPPRRI